MKEAAAKHSTLEAWFAFNAKLQAKGSTLLDGADFAHVHVMDMPAHCVWHPKASVWKPRKQRSDKTIGRLCAAAPTEQGRHFLYILLLHTPGATCWDDLRRIPGQDSPAPTLQDAARQRGLLDDVDELRLAIVDAAAWRMPRQLRDFFANLLLHGGCRRCCAVLG